jgi:hypothetical protein
MIENTTKYDLVTRIVYQHEYLPIPIFTKGPDHCAPPRYVFFTVKVQYSFNTGRYSNKCMVVHLYYYYVKIKTKISRTVVEFV